jgi:competence protein ComEC
MSLQQKYSWQSIPFLRLLIPFSAGLLVAHQFHISTAQLQKIAFGALLILFAFYAIPADKKMRWMGIGGIAIQSLLFVFGIGIYNRQDLRNQEDWVGYRYSKYDTILAIIQEPLIQKRKTWKALARIISVQHHGTWMPATSNILIYIKNDSLASKLETGDEIKFQEPLQKISNNFNTNNFDFVTYCAFQQVYFQLFLPDTATLLYKKVDPTLKYYLYKTRNHVLQVLKNAIPGKTEQSVAEALLIGYKEDLDKTLVQSYSNTGVVHIIAISGLHLAMIYGLLIYLLKPIGNKKWNNQIRTLIVLSVLWGFSFITGGAAAILRSAVGFSFLLISKNLGYKNETLNTIAASAFLLLLYDPFLLWDIGFQLSYTAVLGIVLFSRHVANWFHFKNKLLSMVWQINSITISAQVLTLPIVLYQFHQFPNLFLFTNFLVVPLSGFILYAELLLLLVSPIPVLLKCFGVITGFLIDEMNGIIERTNRLPFALTRNISISIPETILLYLLIASLFIWLMYKHSKGFIAALAIIFILVLIRSAGNYSFLYP